MEKQNIESADDFMITTYDNPFDPFTQEDDWNQFDVEHGYFTWQRAEKLMPSNWLRMTDREREYYINLALDRLVEILPSIYFKVFKSSEEKEERIQKFSKLSKISKEFVSTP